MTTTVSDASTGSADELRAQLTERLIKDGTIRTDAIGAAFRQVPRHLFLPGLPLTEAYADEPAYTKHEGDGTRISAASQPKIVAMMLEQLGIQPGERLLELGAAATRPTSPVLEGTGRDVVARSPPPSIPPSGKACP